MYDGLHSQSEQFSDVIHRKLFLQTLQSGTMSQSPAPESNGDSRDPSGFLSEIIGAPVTVKLNSGIVYKGRSARDRGLHIRLTTAQATFSLSMAI